MDRRDIIEDAPKPTPRKFRWRLLVLLLILIPANAYWVILSEVVRYAGHPTTISLFYNCVFWLCLLVGVNHLLRRFAPKLALYRLELLTLYFTLQLTSALGGHDMAEVLLPILSHATFYADNANDWVNILLPQIPPWLVVTDKEAVKQFYNGHATLYDVANLRAWCVPILMWTGFMGVLTGTMLCLNLLLRRQWTESERLPFPLIYLPLEITSEDTTLFRNRLFWLGVGVAAVLQLYNGFAHLYPSLPMLPIKAQNLGGQGVFGTRPWNAVGALNISFYPFAIALGLLLPTDFLFSSWFFFWFWKAQLVISSALAWDRTPNFPYVNSQSLGAYIGISLTALYLARHHLGQILRHLWDPHSVPMDDPDAPISYRLAAFGTLVGVALLFAFCLTAGMPPLLIVAFFLIYLAIALAVTRLRGELGPPVHDLHNSGPDAILPKVFGPTNLDERSLTLFGLFFGFNRAYRSHPMPIQLEAMATATRANESSTPMLGILLFAGFFGPLCAFWAILHFGYSVGASSASIGPPNVLTIFGSEAWGRYTNQIRVPQPPQVGEGIAVVGGTGFAILLNILRIRVLGFPFHPVGYAVSSSWGMGLLWLPMLMAWVVKTLLLRYGGLALYRQILPLAYGVIIAECVVGSGWTLLGMFTDIPTYGFWP
jgi:hypothetical protein